MTRDQFIKAYAARSGLSDQWADLGFIEVGGRMRLALPCACENEGCEGWAMVGPDSVISHLDLYAPEPLRSAWHKANEQTAQRTDG